MEALKETLCEGYTSRMSTEKAVGHHRRGHSSHHLSLWHEASFCGLTVTLCSRNLSIWYEMLPSSRCANSQNHHGVCFQDSSLEFCPQILHISQWSCGWFQWEALALAWSWDWILPIASLSPSVAGLCQPEAEQNQITSYPSFTICCLYLELLVQASTTKHTCV